MPTRNRSLPALTGAMILPASVRLGGPLPDPRVLLGQGRPTTGGPS
ncbi:hypothetical protein [Actinomycetospora sp. TBRC 11914]|nr:hypothetical protein [Actinomycetospora sp. TBRC 11914]NMO91762.1 hypothetical protein [Actinomycetospora sp. TBRC 11914]